MTAKTPRTSLSLFHLLCLSLFLAGCATLERSKENSEGATEPLPPSPLPRRPSLSFQVEADSPIYSKALLAAAAWSKALGIPITASPDGDIPLFQVDTFGSDCAEAVAALPEFNHNACSQVAEPPEAGHTEILASTPVNFLFSTILHEMGHHLRGTGGHLPDSSNIAAIMRTVPLPVATAITQDDIDWVCAGPRLACAPA